MRDFLVGVNLSMHFLASHSRIEGASWTNPSIAFFNDQRLVPRLEPGSSTKCQTSDTRVAFDAGRCSWFGSASVATFRVSPSRRCATLCRDLDSCSGSVPPPTPPAPRRSGPLPPPLILYRLPRQRLGVDRAGPAPATRSLVGRLLFCSRLPELHQLLGMIGHFLFFIFFSPQPSLRHMSSSNRPSKDSIGRTPRFLIIHTIPRS